MSLSDCPKCWDTPCTCGYEFRRYSKPMLADFIESVLAYHTNEDAQKVLEVVTNRIKDRKSIKQSD